MCAGRETGKGTVKITHGKPSGPDANASALSIALEGAGTACQGIYIGNDAGNPTTGDLLHIRNGGPGTDLLRLTAPGRLELADAGLRGRPRRRRRREPCIAPIRRLLATDGALLLDRGRRERQRRGAGARRRFPRQRRSR